ncbi:hypothetical protein PMAYCL1PPCAC_15219, partial [Pristionchus mayeri]
YILIKGEIGFEDHQYSTIFVKGEDMGVRQLLCIPEQTESGVVGYNIRTLADSILNTLDLQGWQTRVRSQRRDGVFLVRIPVGTLLNLLEHQRWKVVSVNGPDVADGSYTFTLRKGGG